MLRCVFWAFLLLLALSAPLEAAVDLVTLPTREGTQLAIYNSEDITMVREHRLLTVKQGINRRLTTKDTKGTKAILCAPCGLCGKNQGLSYNRAVRNTVTASISI